MISLSKFDKEQVKDLTYLKLCQNKSHMGPVSEEKVAQARASMLSAAANKVRVTAGFTIKITSDPKEETKTNSQNQSFMITGLGDDSPKVTTTYAVYFMQAWDNIFKSEGTPDYVNKLTEALEARARAYKTLGINPTSGEKPNLSADQRVVYNSIVGPTGFDYYEYHIAFKLAGQKKFVRSKTYRSLKPLNKSQILDKLKSEVERLKTKITVASKQVTN
jgi:hypothetical protein